VLEQGSTYYNPKIAKKNRYTNILPGAEHRVVLQTCDNDPCSDYINANVHRVRYFSLVCVY
jgi:protein tyrosine phosphatase